MAVTTTATGSSAAGPVATRWTPVSAPTHSNSSPTGILVSERVTGLSSSGTPPSTDFDDDMGAVAAWSPAAGKASSTASSGSIKHRVISLVGEEQQQKS